MVKCSFCGTEIAKGTGKMYIKADSKIFYFCKSKCQNNMIHLKRKPLKTRWSKLFVKTKSKKS